MEQYIKKSTVVAEIERIEYETNYEPFTEEVLGKRKICKDIKDFLNTIKGKEVDLEKEIDDYINEHFMPMARHFFELGLKAKGE